jgi:hypothetical protein
MPTYSIYFIASGTSKYTLDKRNKNNNLLYSGFKELINLRQNEYFQRNILYPASPIPVDQVIGLDAVGAVARVDPVDAVPRAYDAAHANRASPPIHNYIFTSMDRSCIESSLILFSNIPRKNIEVMNYLNEVYNKKEEYNLLYRNIDPTIHNTHYLEQLNYGKNLNLKSLMFQLPSILPPNNPNEYKYYFNAGYFVELLYKTILQKINQNNMHDFVIVCQSNAIRRILAYLNNSIYSKIRGQSFENSSVWEVKITFPFRGVVTLPAFAGVGLARVGAVAAAVPGNAAITKSQIIINLISKIYPVDREHGPLTRKGNKYFYDFKDTSMPLFEYIKDLPLNLLTLIKKSSNNSNKKNNKNEEENTNIITKHTTISKTKNYKPIKNFLSLIESVIQ